MFCFRLSLQAFTPLFRLRCTLTIVKSIGISHIKCPVQFKTQNELMDQENAILSLTHGPQRPFAMRTFCSSSFTGSSCDVIKPTGFTLGSYEKPVAYSERQHNMSSTYAYHWEKIQMPSDLKDAYFLWYVSCHKIISVKYRTQNNNQQKQVNSSYLLFSSQTSNNSFLFFTLIKWPSRTFIKLFLLTFDPSFCLPLCYSLMNRVYY